MRRRARGRLAVLEDDEELSITTRPPRLRGSVRLSRPRRDSDFGALLGVPWWVWVLGAATTVSVVVWWLVSRGEPDPEVQTVPPDSSSAPDVDLMDVGNGFKLRRDAGQSYLAMRAAALAEGVALPISTAWRSLAYQQRLYDAWIAFKEGRGPAAPMAAKPGPNAPHQKGIAIDFEGIDSRKSNFNPARRKWLDANAGRFGWKNTGASFSYFEPWHWEFVGGPVVS